MNLDEQKKLYLITQNLEYFFVSEQKKIREFRVKLSKILFQTIGENLNIVYITHQEILNFLIQHINKETIISLDKGIYSSFIKDKIFLQIDITRYYEGNNLEQSIIDSQYMYKSSSSESLEKQIVSIKNKLNKEGINSVYLWDDGKFSGGSVKVIIELLNKYDIKVVGCILGINVGGDSHIMSIPIYSFYSIKKENYQGWMPENDFTRLGGGTVKNGKIPYIQSEKMIEKRLKIMGNIKDFKKKINVINNILVIK